VINSTKYSYLILRIGLAAVFLWFGVDKFFHPTFWINTSIPASIIALVGKVGISATQLIYLNGVFDVLIALSLITGVFIQFFAFCAGLLVLFNLVFTGLNETTVHDIGLIGACISVFLWPERQR